MKNNQINLFTTPSPTTTDDLSEMELKIKLYNKMYQNQSIDTHDIHQQLHNILFKSISLDQECLNAQDTESSLRKSRFYNIDFYYLIYLSMEKKYISSLTKHFASRYFNESIEDMISDRWIKKVHLYHIHALKGTHHCDDMIKDFFKAEMGNRSTHKVYSYKMIITVVSVDVKKKWGYGFLTPIKIEIDFINALLLYIRRAVIKNRIEDIQLGVEIYQRTLNLTKPKLYFSRIDHKIPYTTSGTKKGVAYHNKYDMKSLMKIDEVHKICNGDLLKVQDNLLKMVNKNKLGHGNEKLEGRVWAKSDIKSSKETLEKIDKTLKHKEQLKRLEEYIRGRPKTIDPHLFVRP
ncbi:hypothetical protein Tco_0321664 [Tanacetum coccineum]